MTVFLVDLEAVETKYTGQWKAHVPAPHISESNKRRKGVPSGRLGISTSLKGTPQPVLICPHCAKQGGVSGMKRYHFDRCKEKK